MCSFKFRERLINDLCQISEKKNLHAVSIKYGMIKVHPSSKLTYLSKTFFLFLFLN